MNNDDNDSNEGYDDINDNDESSLMMTTLLSVVFISPPLSERFCTLSPVEGHSCKPIVHQDDTQKKITAYN